MKLQMSTAWLLLLWVGASFQAAPEAKKLRIAVVSTFPPVNCGIAEFTRNMSESIVEAANNQVEIHVYSTSKDPHRLPPYHSPGIFVKQVEYTQRGEKHVLAQMAAEINRSKYDVLIVQHEDGLMYNHKHFAPFLQLISPAIRTYVFIHSGLSYPDMSRRNEYKKLAAFSDGVVALGWKVKKALRHAYGIRDSKILYFPHGVTTVESRTKRAKDPSKFVVLMSGIMKKEKGTFVAVKALELLRKHGKLGNIQLRIVGRDNTGGRHHRAVTALVHKKGLAAHFHWECRFTSVEELTQEHQLADVFLAPFQGEVPTSGTLTFAMSCGLPVVATPFGMSGELLGLKTRVPEGSAGATSRSQKEKISYTKYGVVVPHNSVIAVANALRALMVKPVMRSSMGASAKKKLDKITWKKVGRALYTYFRSGQLPKPLLPDPYKKKQYKSACHWTGAKIVDFDQEKAETPENGAYVLYTDPFLVINAEIENGKIASLAVRVYREQPIKRGVKYREAFVYASIKGLPRVLPGSSMTRRVGRRIQIVDPGKILRAKQTGNTLLIKTPNVSFSVGPGVGRCINLKFHQDNRFGYARGLLGATLMKKYSFPNVTILRPSAWELPQWDRAAFAGNPKTSVDSRYKGVFYGAPLTRLTKIQQGKQVQKQYRLSQLLAPGKEGGALRKSLFQHWGNPRVALRLLIKNTLPEKSLADLSLEQYLVLDYISRRR